MRNIIVEFDLPYALYLDQGRIFKIRLNEKMYEARFTDKRFLGETRRGFGKAVNLELKNDRHGTFRYTRISLLFQTAKPKETEREFIEEARAVVNRIIETYRFLTRKTYIEPIISTDIVGPVVKFQLPDSTWECAAIITFGSGLVSILPNEPSTVQDNIQQMLVEEKTIPVYENLLLTARGCFDKEDFRAAMVEGYVAVDVCVDHFLRKVYRSWTWSEMQIERHLRFNRNWQIQTRLKSLIKETTGKDLTINAIRWGAWLRAKRLRDNVVHSGKMFSCLDRDNVQSALVAMEAMVHLVQSLTPYISDKNRVIYL